MAKNNISKMPKRLDVNVGYMIVGVIFIYIVISVIIYLTSKKTTIYEVQPGSLALDNVYTALIIRDENVYSSDYSGTYNRFSDDESKTTQKTVIYSIDEAGRVSEQIRKLSSTELTDTSLKDIAKVLSKYTLNYTDNSFSSVYELHDSLSHKLTAYHSNLVLDDIEKLVRDTDSRNLFHLVTAKDSGIAMYSYDNLTNLRESELSEECFDTTKYKNTVIEDYTVLNVGDPSYRLIHSDNWSLYIQLSDTEANSMMNDTTAQIRFIEKDITCTTNFKILQINGKYYGKLSLHKYMINFADLRYVRIELTQNCATGLKIPASAVFSKNLYTIPKEYKTSDGTFVKQYYTDKGEIKFDSIETTIYDEDDKYCYVSMDDFSAGDMLVQEKDPDSNEETEPFMVGTIGERNGVYCVNKGYAVFKIVEILDQNDEYIIIKRGSKYGLAIHDHIVLNHETVSENKIVN